MTEKITAFDIARLLDTDADIQEFLADAALEAVHVKIVVA